VTFRAIRNNPPQTCPGLHAIYLASHATGARIEGNTFTDFCGSAIKLRDDSGGATITGNRFSVRMAPRESRNGSATWTAPTNAPRPPGNARRPDRDRPQRLWRDARQPAHPRAGSRAQRPWCPPGSARARFILPGGKTLP
jgi:hypothetical protein